MRNSPFDLAQTSGTHDQHGGFVVVDDVEEHVARILRVPCLAGDGHVQARALQERCSLTDEDVGKALTL